MNISLISDRLQHKLRLLDEIGSRHIDDVFPLISVDKSELLKFKKILREEELYGPGENPIYHFSERLNVSLALRQSFQNKKM